MAIQLTAEKPRASTYLLMKTHRAVNRAKRSRPRLVRRNGKPYSKGIANMTLDRRAALRPYARGFTYTLAVFLTGVIAWLSFR
jgi:hypothetical protein